MTNVIFLSFDLKIDIKSWFLVDLQGSDTELILYQLLSWEVQQDTAKKGFCMLDADFSSDKLRDLAFSIQSLWTEDSRVWLKMPCRIMIFKLCEFEDHCYNINNYIDHHAIIDLPFLSTDKKKKLHLPISIFIYLCLYINIIRTSAKWICNVLITITVQNPKISNMYVWEMEFIWFIKSSELCLTGTYVVSIVLIMHLIL